MYHQKGAQEEIIIFTRYPRPGMTKTRLIPELGPEGAAHIQRAMTERIVGKARAVAGERGLSLFIYYTGGSVPLMQQWLGTDLFFREQDGFDLGQRMKNAFLDSRRRGAERCIIIGSDCPALELSLLVEALNSLQEEKLVLGPAVDGGYYLIGITADLPAEKLTGLFNGIGWGSSEVFPATLERAGLAGCNPVILRQLHDVDLPRDLAYFDNYPDPQ